MRAARTGFAASRPPHAVPLEFLRLLATRSLVASYVPLRGEADPALLAAACADHSLGLCLPVVADRALPMRFLRWTPGDPLIEGPFGLHQPMADAPPATPDIVLVPLLAFDGRGNRLGQGAGHYDRALAQLPEALRIGIAWSVQQVHDLPVDRWDVPLHGIVTENGWISPENEQ